MLGRAELLERLVVPAAAGLQHAAHNAHQQRDAGPGISLQGRCGAPQPSLAFVELTHPDHHARERDERGRDDRLRVPAVPAGEGYRLVAAPPGSGERADLRRETQLRKAADFEVGPADLPGQDGALLQVAFSIW